MPHVASYVVLFSFGFSVVVLLHFETDKCKCRCDTDSKVHRMISFYKEYFFFFFKLPNFEMFAVSFTDVKLTIGLQGDMPCQITYIQVLSS